MKLEKILRHAAKVWTISFSSSTDWKEPRPGYQKELNNYSSDELRGNIEADVRKTDTTPYFFRYHGTAMFEKVLGGHIIVHAGNRKAMLTFSLNLS